LMRFFVTGGCKQWDSDVIDAAAFKSREELRRMARRKERHRFVARCYGIGRPKLSYECAKPAAV